MALPKRRYDTTRPVAERRDGAVTQDLLDRLGWQQKEFAEHIEVRCATVNDWIKNRAPVPKVVLLYLRMLVQLHGKRDSINGDADEDS